MKKIEDYLHLYLGCQLTVEVSNYYFVHNLAIHKGSTIRLTKYILSAIEAYGTGLVYKPMLRPLSSMTEKEILEVCKLFSPTAWGDYRFKKWIATKDPKSDKSWLAYDVTNENSTYSFVVDLIDGDITLYDGEDYELVHVNNNYRFWYVQKGLDIFQLIENNIALPLI